MRGSKQGLPLSFQNNSLWLPNVSGSMANAEMCYENSSRIDQKRPHQWCVDSPEQELFFSKKQSVEPFKGISGPTILESSLGHDGSHFQSESTIPSLFNPKPVRSPNVPDNSVPPVTASLNLEKDLENQFGNDPSICLTMSQAVNGSLCLNSGPGKVKVNEVRTSENCLSDFMESTFTRGERNEVVTTTYLRPGKSMFSGPNYNTALGNAISADPAYSKTDKSFFSVGQSSKRDGNFMLGNPYYNNGINTNVLSIGQAFNRGNYSINALGEQFEKETVNYCPTYNRGQENLFTLDPFYSKANETFMSAGSSKEGTHIAFQGQQDATVASLGALYNTENSRILSMVEHSKKGEERTIYFGGLQNNVEGRDHSGRLISSYDVLLNQSSALSSGLLGQRESTDQPSANAILASSSNADGAPKNKDQKIRKGSSNNFPSNVKSLLATGILDGVAVKYVSWSREKNLRAVIKGTGYMCSCKDCKLVKIINAFEFELHAGCKTKHPNNHIYFENGKTIYAVVQELKTTPQERLFDVMQNVTGSSVNQKNFSAWKASYQAATRELQRIYGKDDLVVAPPS